MSEQLSSQPAARRDRERILVVDDEKFIGDALAVYLQSEGFLVEACTSGETAIKKLTSNDYALAVVDVLMPGISGLDLLTHIKLERPDTEVIVSSGCGSLEVAVEALRRGAYDYIAKPILDYDEELLKIVSKALERRRLFARNRELHRNLLEQTQELEHARRELTKHGRENRDLLLGLLQLTQAENYRELCECLQRTLPKLGISGLTWVRFEDEEIALTEIGTVQVSEKRLPLSSPPGPPLEGLENSLSPLEVGALRKVNLSHSTANWQQLFPCRIFAGSFGFLALPRELHGETAQLTQLIASVLATACDALIPASS